MDQLKQFGRTIRRIQFWLICTIVLAMSTAMWFVAVGKIAKEKESRAQALKGLFGQVDARNAFLGQFEHVINPRVLAVEARRRR